ncbi:MAG: hypothetical protein LBQ24_07945 [Candidatus Peribacteria bacterium]|nr:hypothetical protein [Candidatus Peribacteria bacterium]
MSVGGSSSYYWSSTEYNGNANHAWKLTIGGNTTVDLKTNYTQNYVVCVYEV